MVALLGNITVEEIARMVCEGYFRLKPLVQTEVEILDF